jgi:hypothetical protein
MIPPPGVTGGVLSNIMAREKTSIKVPLMGDPPQPVGPPDCRSYIRAAGLGAALFGWASFAIASASARTFPIPPDHPAASIDIPDDWRPVSVGGGVEGAPSNAAVRLAVQFIPASELDKASAAAITKLAQNGVAVDPETRRVAQRRYNGFDAVKIDYSGTDPNGESDITIILVVLPAKSGFVAVCTWGDDEAQESVSNDLQTIADSVELAR